MRNMVEKLILEYINSCEICEYTDYQSKSSVKRHNQSVDRMYEIVEEIKSLGDNATHQFAELLNHPVSSKWLAHHLIEKVSISEELKYKCINIIRKLAMDNSQTGLGEKMWLEERDISI